MFSLPSVANAPSFRVLWYSASLGSHGWFLSRMAYGMFSWHKPFAQVHTPNYIGVVASIALVSIGIGIQKNNAANKHSIARAVNICTLEASQTAHDSAIKIAVSEYNAQEYQLHKSGRLAPPRHQQSDA